MGTDFWRPLTGFLLDRPVREGTIDRADVERFVLTDSPVEAIRSVPDVAMRRVGLTYGPRLRRRWYLGERPLAPGTGPHGGTVPRKPAP